MTKATRKTDSRRPEKDTAAFSKLSRRHIIIGWWSLFVFASGGMILEALHGLKMGFYLDTGNQVRRLMWTLAHAHGTLIALIHLAFASVLRTTPRWNLDSARLTSRCFIGAIGLMPAGFFLGGTQIHGGDPGLGVVLVPIGGLLLLAAIMLTARGVSANAR